MILSADWDVSAITDMSYILFVNGSKISSDSYSYNADISNYITNDDDHTFFNADLSNWDTSSVTDMEGTFYAAESFNCAIGAWDVRKVTSMKGMFYRCESFNNPLDWDTSSVSTMANMFKEAITFNSDLLFDTSNIISMEGMFQDSSFNSPSIASWDVQKVKTMKFMFGVNTYNLGSMTEYLLFNVDISAWNVRSVTNFDYMFYTSNNYWYSSVTVTAFNQVLCWDLDFSNYITIDSMFTDGDASLLNPDAAKCNCAVNEFYDGTACSACEPGTISFGKTESCTPCTDLMCPPSPSPTVSALPSVTPAPTVTPKPTALPSATPTMDPTMVQITEISSSYVSTPAVKTEILHAEEIMLNGVELSASSRRLTSDSGMHSDLIGELQHKQETMMAHIDSQHATIDTLRSTNDALQAKFDAQQAAIADIQTRLNQIWNRT